ncbi:MAG: prepilin-type N-terminal cleavage/methylation domain-containing protein, partial [Planctomycetia bacterium]
MTARFKTCVFLLQAARLHSSSAAFTLIEMLVVLVIV